MIKDLIVQYLKAIDFTKYQTRLQIVLTGFFGGILSAALGWLAAWGKLPWLDVATMSSTAAGAIAAGLSGLLIGILQAIMTRAVNWLNATGNMPQVERVVMKDEAKALSDSVPSAKVDTK